MKRKSVLLLILSMLCVGLLSVRHDHAEGKIEVTELGPNLYKLRYDKVNLVASVGTDGVFLSDTAFEQVGEEIREELKKLGRDDVKIIINTHWHSDHTGGNKVFGKEAAIIAHHNVRKLLSENQALEFWEEKHDAFPEYARPHLTFSDKLTIQFNGEDIELTHFPNGHSDGDVIVHFKKTGVVHLGDLLFSDGFPAIDFENGGNAALWVENLQKIIKLMPENSTFVAGHGRNYSLEELKKYHDMMKSTVKRIQETMDCGKNLEDMKNAQILKEWQAWEEAHFPCDMWIEMVYKSLTRVVVENLKIDDLR